MSKTKELTINVTRLIQTAPYESFQTSVSEVIELASKDDVAKVRIKKVEELTEFLNSKEKSIRKTFKGKDK